MEPLEVAGGFWSPDDESNTVNGTLTWKPGSRARLILEERLIDELANPVTFTDNGVQISHSGDPARIVADGVPRVILGDTADGAATGVDSYLRSPPRHLTTPLFQQVWDPYTLVLGAHLPDGHGAEFDAVRFAIDNPGWWDQLLDGGSASDGAGDVFCERGEDGLVWLQFQPATAALTLRSADRALGSIITLMKLAVDVDLTPLGVQVRQRDRTDWLDVLTRDQDPSNTSWPDPRNFLSPAAVTLERIARWLTIEQSMDGLAAAVANPVKGQAIQVHALVAGSLVEGIHKRIDGRERTYKERAGDLHEVAQRIAPDITNPIVEWANLVKTTRHDLAHHNTGRSFEQHFYNWLISESSVIWVLRLCLLSHAGFDDQEIRDALNDHQRYEFYRENLKIHVQEEAAI